MAKLLFFTSDYNIGQSSLLTDQLVSLHNSMVDVVAISGEKEQERGLHERTRNLGVDVRYVKGLDEHANFVGLAKQIAGIVRKESVRYVHVQNNWQMALVVFAKFILLRKLDLKIVYTLHGFRHNSPIKSMIARVVIGSMLWLFATKVICMCTYLKNKFRFLGKKIMILPLGISDEYFYSEQPSLPQNGLQMVFPAQFRKGKNQDLIIRAFACHIRKSDDKDSHLYLPGMGELSESMKILTKELGISDRVSFPGFCTKQEVLQLYLKCNIGIVASNSETFGQAIVEPFVLGRCVVSTHVGIADDILKDGENGFFFSTEDDLVNIFGSLYNSPQLIAKSGEINFEKRTMFSWKSVTEHYVDMIRNL